MTKSIAAQDRAWIERSNEFNQQVIQMQAPFGPEGASQSSLEQHDGLALDLGPNLPDWFIAAEEAKLADLRVGTRFVLGDKLMLEK